MEKMLEFSSSMLSKPSVLSKLFVDRSQYQTRHRGSTTMYSLTFCVHAHRSRPDGRSHYVVIAGWMQAGTLGIIGISFLYRLDSLPITQPNHWKEVKALTQPGKNHQMAPPFLDLLTPGEGLLVPLCQYPSLKYSMHNKINNSIRSQYESEMPTSLHKQTQIVG